MVACILCYEVCFNLFFLCHTYVVPAASSVDSTDSAGFSAAKFFSGSVLVTSPAVVDRLAILVMLLEWPMLAFCVMKFVSLCYFLLYICCCCCCFFWFHQLWLVWAWLWNRFFHYSLQWELVLAYLALQWCAILLSTQMSGLAISSWPASCSSVCNYVRISCFLWDLKIYLYPPPSPRVLCLESLLTFSVMAKHQQARCTSQMKNLAGCILNAPT